MLRFARIANHRDLIGKKFGNKGILLASCRHSQPLEKLPYFPNMETLVVDNCTDNFTYYTVHPEIMPKVKQIFFLCRFDHELRYRFSSTVTIYAPHGATGYRKINNIIYLPNFVLENETRGQEEPIEFLD